MYNSIALILGHLVGDYLLQTRRMALGKTKRGMDGHLLCTYHCIAYSAAVSVFVCLGGWTCGIHSLTVAFILAFVSHWPIDRFSLASKWLKMIHQDPLDDMLSPDTCKIDRARKMFIPVIYTITDNTMHLVIMWFLFSMVGQ
mgnify:CR=1 FL=1